MKQPGKPGCVHTLLCTNILLGIVLFVIAAYLIITGEYATLEMREKSEAVLNALAIGGLLYSIFNWFLDLTLNPAFKSDRS